MRFVTSQVTIVLGAIAAFTIVSLAILLLHQSPAAAAPTFTGENVLGDVKLAWDGVAKKAYCTRIDGVRGKRPMTRYSADVSGQNQHIFDVAAAGAYVCRVTGGDYYRPVQVSTCDPDVYDRDSWGSYPSVPDDAVARWSTPDDNLNDKSLQHDHHVALRDAHDSGACGWSSADKDTFSSEAQNLNPTAASFNASKGSRSPDELTGIAAGVIDTDAEKCDYAIQHSRMKRKYGLAMTPDEKSTTESWMRLCKWPR